MDGTLIRVLRGGYSKTARSRPGHRAAGRDAVGARRAAARPVRRRRLADDLAERPAEGPEAPEADVEADLGHAAAGLAQQEHRPLDAPSLQVAVRRLAERRLE